MLVFTIITARLGSPPPSNAADDAIRSQSAPPQPDNTTLDPAFIAEMRARAERHKTFEGDPCTGNCSGHQAGYDWAQKNLITDREDCDTAGDHYNSPSFAAGCRSYLDEGRYDRDLDDHDTSQDQDPPQIN